MDLFIIFKISFLVIDLLRLLDSSSFNFDGFCVSRNQSISSGFFSLMEYAFSASGAVLRVSVRGLKLTLTPNEGESY
jgi:hypothetical protein